MEELLLEMLKMQDYAITNWHLDKKQLTLTIRVIKKTKSYICSKCNFVYEQAYDHRRMNCRTLSILGYKVYLSYPRYRVNCHHCRGIKSELISFVDLKSKYAEAYENHIARLCEEMSNCSVARLEGISDRQVYRIDKHYLALRYKNYHLKGSIEIAAVDEVYFRRLRGRVHERCFVTNLLDVKKRKVVENAEGRSQASLEKIFQKIGKNHCRKIKVIAADMHDPYWVAVEKHAPQADGVLDRFHIIRQANEALNEIRKLQLKRLVSADEKAYLHSKNRWILMRKPSKRSGQDNKFINQLERINKPLYTATLLIEKLHHFFNAVTVENAKKLFLEWKLCVYEAKLKPFIILLKTLERKSHLLWNYFKHRISNSVIEGVNNKIKVIKRTAYGFRNLDYFRLKILQRCGYLNSRWMAR